MCINFQWITKMGKTISFTREGYVISSGKSGKMPDTHLYIGYIQW